MKQPIIKHKHIKVIPTTDTPVIYVGFFVCGMMSRFDDKKIRSFIFLLIKK